VVPEEQALIGELMAETGISNMGAYMWLNGYVLHVDRSDIRELLPSSGAAPTTSAKWRSM
jgi:hypothetical protein